MNTRQVISGVAVLCLTLATAAWWLDARAGDEPVKADEPPMSFWMEKKLTHAQDLLSALATEDFESLASAADSMKRLSKIEALVRRRDTEKYRTQLQIFQFANDELQRMAAEKNIDGAALAFTQLTLSCVNCHKQLRANGS